MPSISTQQAANLFLRDAGRSMQECISGADRLDRLTSSVASQQADFCRMSLIPALYSYWERCFRVVLSQFVQYLSQVGLPLSVAHEKAARASVQFAIRRQLAEYEAQTHQDVFTNSKISVSQILELYKSLGKIGENAYMRFIDPSDCVVTDSNVGFKVLQKNLDRLGVGIESLKSRLADLFGPDGRPWVLHSEIEALLWLRNKVAHGETLQPLSGAAWTRHKTFTCDLMYAFVLDLHDAFCQPHRLLATHLRPAGS